MEKKINNYLTLSIVIVMLSVFMSHALPQVNSPRASGSGKSDRIILALDASGSMCQEVTQCAGASNNDPLNKRVDGANVFVDSVAKKCPQCEIGVVVYTGVGNDSTGTGTVRKTLPAKKLNDTAAIATLHAAINNAGCMSRPAKTLSGEKLAKRAMTFTGLALDTAIKMVDAGYDTAGIRMERHVILLTDGDWQGQKPAEMFAMYAENYPQRPLPVIHGVFISDSTNHVANGFPPQGMLYCDTANGNIVPMDLSFLKLAVQVTGGLYFPGSTPQTIVATFDSLVDVFALSSTGARFVPVRHLKSVTDGPAIAVFDMRGRLLTTDAQNMSRIRMFDCQGINFVKYQNGRVVRRVNVIR